MESLYIGGVLWAIGGVLVGAVLGHFSGRHDERKRWERALLERAGLSGRNAADRALSQILDKNDPMRHERLEQAIEAIAVEVERISESQRYVTKLLGDRGLSKLADTSKPPRSPTPGSVRSAS